MTCAALISRTDIEIVSNQLGRSARGIIGVEGRCQFSLPQVVKTASFIEAGKPFPTLFWLTCPVKIKAVARLEDEGWAGMLQAKLGQDPALKAKLAQAHEEYKGLRHCLAEQDGHPVFKTGIGGVKGIDGIKCLHAHYAHFLATGSNPIGEMVAKRLEATSGLSCKRRCDAK